MASRARPISTRIAANTRPGVPMIHSSARKMISRMNVVPRSSPSITSMARKPTPGSSGMSSCRQSASWFSFSLRVSRSAPHSRNANLASSDGWNWKPPICSQRAAPPLPGAGVTNRTTTSPSSEMNISG